MTELIKHLPDNIKNVLGQMITAKNIPHAIIIEGAASAVIDIIIKILCQYAVCKNENSPCGSCTACEKVKMNIHPDIYTLKGSLSSGNVGVDDIRRLCSDTLIKPNEAPCKVYILPECDKLNIQSQNALLKSLEEPIQNTLFILQCKSSSALLETVRSRCMRISIGSEEKEIEESKRDAVNAAEKIAFSICQSSEFPLLCAIGELGNQRELIKDVLYFLTLIITDACANAQGEAAKALKKSVKASSLCKMNNICIRAFEAMNSNANINILTTWLCAAFKGAKNNS